MPRKILGLFFIFSKSIYGNIPFAKSPPFAVNIALTSLSLNILFKSSALCFGVPAQYSSSANKYFPYFTFSPKLSKYLVAFSKYCLSLLFRDLSGAITPIVSPICNLFANNIVILLSFL